MNKTRLLAAFFIFLGLIVLLTFLLAPRVLKIEGVRNQVSQALARSTGGEFTCSRIDLTWFPVPHFTFNNVSARFAGSELSAPEIKVYTGLAFLVGHSRRMRSIEMIRPKIKITSSSRQNQSETMILPAQKIRLRKTKIIIPAIKQWTSREIRIGDLDLDIREHNGSLGIKGKGRSDVSGPLAVNFFLDKKARTFRGNYRIEGLNPAVITPHHGAGRVLFTETPVSLKGDFDGSGDVFTLRGEGTFPCLMVKTQTGNGIEIRCGELLFSAEKRGGDFKISLDRLKIPRPGLNLSGSIERTVRPSDNGTGKPRWNIDLQGEDIDLSEIRSDLLALWPKHHVVTTVCDVVRGGRTKSVSFTFKGPAEDFAHLRAMRITADVAGADIHPPHTPLFLTDARGPITIENGYLEGHDLKAGLGNSTGNNGALRLDLLHRDRAFTLELDLDADLAALPTVLNGLVKWEKFREELKHFKRVTGRGKAHLKLGDSLNNLKTSVLVHDAVGQAYYDRLPWPFTIGGGTIAIEPGKVSWQKISGRAGPHQLATSSGRVSWQKNGPASFEVLPSSGTIDSGNLLSVMRSHHFLPDIFGKTISKLSGPVAVDNFTLKGDPGKPSGWQYSMEIRPKGARWKSKLIPGSYLMEKGRGLISNHSIKVSGARAWSMGQPITVNATINHKNFHHLTGGVEIDGQVRKKLADWVIDKGWLPSSLRPLTPVRLNDLTIHFAPKSVRIRGAISAGVAAKAAARINLDLVKKTDRLKIKKLLISEGGEKASIALSQNKAKKDKKLSEISFKGELSGKTINSLLAEPAISFGRLSGDFRLKLPANSPPIFTGRAEANDIYPDKKENGQTKIARVKLDGSRKSTIVRELVIERGGERIEIGGELHPEAVPPAYNLTIESPKLSWDNLNKIREELALKGTDQKGGGKISFNIKKLVNVTGLIGKNYRISMTPAVGELSLNGDRWQTIKVRESRLCGLEFAGILHPFAGELETSFNLYSARDQTVKFKEVLPCLGFTDNLVSGRVSVDANMKGKRSTWEEGRLNLYSDKGFIRRLSLLSKALSILNLTGLVSGSFVSDLNRNGFTYSELDIKSHVKENRLIIDQATIRGSGLNIFAQGWIDLKKRTCEIVMLLAPLKTLDTIIGNLPIIGPAVGGRDTAIVALPVKLTGRIDDPRAEVLPAKEVGAGVVAFITRTLKIPFAIFSPLMDGAGKGRKNNTR